MTTYTEQFAGMTTGILPTNFTERTGATTNYTVENPSDGEAEDDRAFIQDGTTETAGTSMLTFDDVDGDANRDNGELLCRFRVGVDSDQQIHFWQRASGSAGNRTGYLLWFDAGTGPRWGQYVAESFVALDNGINLDADLNSPWLWWTSDQMPTLTLFPAGIWLWVRWRINGTGATVSHSVKIWADGQPEPANWTAEDTDVTAGRITAAGWIGWGRGEFTTSMDTEVDYFSVGTNGDTPAIATSLDLASIRLTQNQLSAAVNDADPTVRLTANQLSAAVNEGDPVVRLSAAYTQVIYSYSPSISPQQTALITPNT